MWSIHSSLLTHNNNIIVDFVDACPCSLLLLLMHLSSECYNTKVVSCKIHICSETSMFNHHHCKKNTWVTLTTFLGCLSCISVTKERYQIDFLEKFIEELLFSYISCIFFSEDLLVFGYIPGIPTTSMQPRNSPGRDM